MAQHQIPLTSEVEWNRAVSSCRPCLGSFLLSCWSMPLELQQKVSYLQTRSDGKLFNLFRLRAKTKVPLKCMWDFLFADDAAIVAHSAEDLQQLLNHFSKACQDLGLTISLKKTQVIGQGMDSPLSIIISTQELEVVHDFLYLGSTISDTLTLGVELDKRIGTPWCVVE